ASRSASCPGCPTWVTAPPSPRPSPPRAAAATSSPTSSSSCPASGSFAPPSPDTPRTVRRPPSRSPSAPLRRLAPVLASPLASAAVLAAATAAHAQACCAGATALSPGRLELHESALVGLQARLSGITGSFDQRGAFIPNPRGTTEVDVEQDFIATL